MTATATRTHEQHGEAEHEGLPGREHPRPRRIDRAVACFVVLATCFGLFFALWTPYFWGPDEGEHVKRALVVSDGQVAPRELMTSRGVDFGGRVPSDVDALILFASQNASDARAGAPAFPLPQVEDPAGFARLADRPLESPPVTAYFENTSTYSPVPYAVYLPAIYLGRAADLSVGDTLLLMRLSGLALSVVLMALALLALRRLRVKWLVLVVALLPTTIFQSAVIGADATTNALAVLFGALFLKAVFFRRSLGRAETAGLLAAGFLLPLGKSAYFIVPLLLLVIGPRQLPPLGRWARVVLGSVVAVTLAAFATWARISSAAGEAQGFMRPMKEWYSVAPAAQAEFVLADPMRFARVLVRTFAANENSWVQGFFGTLGFTFVNIPGSAVVALVVALVLAFGLSERTAAGRLATIATALVAVLSAFGIVVALYLGFSPVGYWSVDGVQGRYFIPLALFALAALLQLVGLRWDMRSPAARRAVPVAVVVLVGYALTTGAAKYALVVGG